MNLRQPILGLLALEMGCSCLSELHFFDQAQRICMAQKLSHISPQEDDLREWNDALGYLTGLPPQPTARAARAQLIQSLSNFRCVEGSRLHGEGEQWE